MRKVKLWEKVVQLEKMRRVLSRELPALNMVEKLRDRAECGE